jgi:hypothetical protein
MKAGTDLWVEYRLAEVEVAVTNAHELQLVAFASRRSCQRNGCYSCRSVSKP